MLLIIIFLCISPWVATVRGDLGQEWTQWKMEQGKVYSSLREGEERFSVFRDSLAMVEEHNRHETRGWQMGMNKFSDLTQAEFESQYLGGYKRTPHLHAKNTNTTIQIDIRNLPDRVDWRDHGVVGEVLDQGACGSCWAFATTQQVESYAALANGHLPRLSTQQVTSCTPNTLHCGGLGGCKGSIAQLGFNYLQLFGQVSEEDYPYYSDYGQDNGCELSLSSMKPVVGLRGYETLPHNSLEAVTHHIATVGPLAVTVAASRWGYYRGGIFDDCNYDQNVVLNHAVQLVGYDKSYWIIKNSWGAAWGEEGYIRLKREVDVKCGTDQMPSDGTACTGGPGSVSQTVCGMCGVLFDVSYPLGVYSMERQP